MINKIIKAKMIMMISRLYEEYGLKVSHTKMSIFKLMPSFIRLSDEDGDLSITINDDIEIVKIEYVIPIKPDVNKHEVLISSIERERISNLEYEAFEKIYNELKQAVMSVARKVKNG